MSDEGATAAGPVDLGAGSATAEFALPAGIQLAGYGVDDRATTGVHDPLRAKAVVFETGASEGGTRATGEDAPAETTVAVVSVDLLDVSRQFTARVEKLLAEADVSVDALVLAATHTHAGPYVPADAMEMNPFHRMESDADAVSSFERTVAETVEAAWAAREPATLRVGRAENDVTPENRRAIGGIHGTIEVPRGRIDPELVVIDVVTASGAEAVLVHYACHPVCSTSAVTQASADWPGVTCDLVAEREDATVLFLNGAAGDINPRDREDSPRSGEAVFEYAREVGTEVADTVTDALADARDGPAAPGTDGREAGIRVASRELDLPLKDVPSVERLETRRTEVEANVDRLAANGEETAARERRLRRDYVDELLGIARWDGDSLSATLRYVEIGDVGLLGVPGEVFVEHGLDWKAAAAEADVDGRTLLPVGYANGYVGYLPTTKEFENGDYEIRTTKVSPEAVLAVREAAFELIAADG